MAKRIMKSISRWRLVLIPAAVLLSANCGEQRATTAADRTTTSTADAGSGSPQLLACPSSQSQATIGILGVLGGTISIGPAVVTIPRGALSLPTLITVKVPASPYMEVDIQANNFTSFLFNSPISVSIDYSRCDPASTAGVALSVWHIDQSTKALLENMGGVNDTVQRRITFSTPHLSGYAIAF
jgi:hypothetical protein